MAVGARSAKEAALGVEPRPYRDLRDFDRMKAVLRAGLRAGTGPRCIHVGDLSWWLFWRPREAAPVEETVWLWEEGDEVAGWVHLFPEHDQALALMVAPRFLGGREHERMHAWVEERLASMVRDGGGDRIRAWSEEGDRTTAALLARHGFVRTERDELSLRRSLAEPVAEPGLPPGFTVRPVAGELEAAARASVTHAAFGSTRSFDDYLSLYRAFMRSPVYPSAIDVMAFAPDGRGAACCVCWTDDELDVGLFEPVATHPDFRRRGLGRAVMQEGLRRLRAAGMREAVVGVALDNEGARALYACVGFRPFDRIYVFEKRV